MRKFQKELGIRHEPYRLCVRTLQRGRSALLHDAIEGIVEHADWLLSHQRLLDALYRRVDVQASDVQVLLERVERLTHNLARLGLDKPAALSNDQIKEVWETLHGFLWDARDVLGAEISTGSLVAQKATAIFDNVADLRDRVDEMLALRSEVASEERVAAYHSARLAVYQPAAMILWAAADAKVAELCELATARLHKTRQAEMTMQQALDDALDDAQADEEEDADGGADDDSYQGLFQQAAAEAPPAAASGAALGLEAAEASTAAAASTPRALPPAAASGSGHGSGGGGRTSGSPQSPTTPSQRKGLAAIAAAARETSPVAKAAAGVVGTAANADAEQVEAAAAVAQALEGVGVAAAAAAEATDPDIDAVILALAALDLALFSFN